ncbi:MAG TPA: phytoene/squalene synthase family protein [Polyangia bacterium]|jgi:phytoene synthase
MTPEQADTAQRILAHHAKSFALAGKLLPAAYRRDAAALYAWCRRCDDAVDTPDDEATRSTAVARLREELAAVYRGEPQSDAVLAAMQDVVRRHGIPRRYAEDLLAGMAMDVGTVRYRTMDELLLYGYRAAGTVGLMMAHLMDVRDASVLRRAADLGIAMQLTNICRDVVEDERRGRVYLPSALLDGNSGPTHTPGRTAGAVAEVLRRADDFYRSGDSGLDRLPFRCAVAIRAARLIYAEIGRLIARRGFDVLSGRAVVPRGRKLRLLARAVSETLVKRLLPARRRAAPPFIPLWFQIPIVSEPDEEVTVVEGVNGVTTHRAQVSP